MLAAALVPVGKKYGTKHFQCIKNKASNIEPQATLAKLGSLLSKGIKPVTAEAPTLGETPDQSALHKLAKEAEKNAKNGNPISYEEAKILDEWAKEYNVPQHHPAEVGSGQHSPGGNYMDHTHIYNIYVPYEYR